MANGGVSSRAGLSTKVEVGAANGLDSASVVSCDNLATVPIGTIDRHIGYLLPQQEAAPRKSLFEPSTSGNNRAGVA